MQGVKTTGEQGFRPVVFESVIDTIAGGGTIDTDSIPTDMKSAGAIPAGTIVGKKDETTGLHKIVTVSGGALSETPLGYVREDVNIDDNPLVAIVISGVVRKAMLNTDYQSIVDDIQTALPKVTIV